MTRVRKQTIIQNSGRSLYSRLKLTKKLIKIIRFDPLNTPSLPKSKNGMIYELRILTPWLVSGIRKLAYGRGFFEAKGLTVAGITMQLHHY